MGNALRTDIASYTGRIGKNRVRRNRIYLFAA
jgi:hypothetical protein